MKKVRHLLAIAVASLSLALAACGSTVSDRSEHHTAGWWDDHLDGLAEPPAPLGWRERQEIRRRVTARKRARAERRTRRAVKENVDYLALLLGGEEN